MNVSQKRSTIQKMKKFKLVIFTILIGSIGFTACKDKNAGGTSDKGLANEMRKERLAHNRKVYETATKMHDNYTRLTALYDIMADDSSNSLKDMDTVAELYMKLNMGVPALKMAEKILVKDPENEKMLELKAEGCMSTGKEAEALNINRKLYEKTKKLKYLFGIANGQIQMGNMKDANETLNRVKASPDYQRDSVDVADNSSGRLQKVPDPALMAYIEAMFAAQKKNYPEMAAKLKQALTIFPDYTNARRDMMALQQQAQQAQQQQQMMQQQQQMAPKK
jgi:tetratricopeptide (TPR) repeat protein